MKKILSFLPSMLFTGILITIFAISIAYATFTENDYGTQTAKILIYNSRWFEILLFIIMINLIGSIQVNKLISKKKWTMFLFHVAFIFILLGAAVTRYFSYEGTMHIREGESSSTLISQSTYISIKAAKNGEVASLEKEVMFSGYTGSKFKESISVGGENISITSIQFVPSAIETVVPDETGEPILSIIAAGSNMQREDVILKMGENKLVQGKNFGFNSTQANAQVNFSEVNGKIFFTSLDSVLLYGMMATIIESFGPGEIIQLSENNVYKLSSISFGLDKYIQKGRSKLMYEESKDNSRITP